MALLLLWGVGLGLISLYFASAPVEYNIALLKSYFGVTGLASLNLFPCVLLAFFGFLLTNRVWGGVLISGATVIAGSLVNYYKILLRNDPFLAADMALVSEATNMTGNYTLTFSWDVIMVILMTAAAVPAAGFLCRSKIKRPPVRLGLLAAVIITGVIGVNSLYFSDKIYSATENIDANYWYMSRWSDRDQFLCRGFMYPFLYSAKNAFEKAPDGYDERESRDILASYGDDDIPQDKKVNVIAIMLEAYADFSDFGTLDFGDDPYEYFHKLQKESLSGRLVTNIFAGGTIDTERSFVTGYSYMSNYRREIPTYASYFRSQGYTTEGGHPGYDWFYNRRNVNSWFGFDNYYFFDDRYETDNVGLMMDKDFFPDILTLFEENKATGKPYFHFSVTYQNHGPYADGFVYDPAVYAVNKGYTDGAYNILNNYLWGINQTDLAIEALIESLRDEEEPVVVALFGDHLPWLGDGAYVYDEIGANIDRSTYEGFFNYYSTPYVIWANDRAKEVTGGSFEGDGGDFSPCFLMNRIFEECGYGGTAFMKAGNELRRNVSVIERSGVFVVDGEITNDPKPEAKEAIKAFRRLEYYMKHDF